MTPSQIGALIKAAREKAGVDQATAARRVGIHVQTLSKYERGAIQKVPVGVLEKLGTLYGYSLTDLTTKPSTATRPKELSQGREKLSNADPADADLDAVRMNRIIAFEREMVRLGADDFEADYVKDSARRFVHAIAQLPEADIEREIETYFDASLRPWVLARVEQRRVQEPLDTAKPEADESAPGATRARGKRA